MFLVLFVGHFFKNKGYDAFTFENPKIQKHYACLQALALFKDETGFNEKDDDALFPDVEGEFLSLISQYFITR